MEAGVEAKLSKSDTAKAALHTNPSHSAALVVVKYSSSKGGWRTPAEIGPNAALTFEPDLGNASVGTTARVRRGFQR